MQITRIGSDYISINEDSLYDENLINIPRVHLIKLDFFKPSESKIKNVLSLYPKTNRFVIEDNIKIYNYVLRNTQKKYYVSNTKGIKLISFFRKNNKIFLNFMNLNVFERQFLLINKCFEDILRNAEVILVDNDILMEKESILNEWNGNVILYDEKYII
jgi:hypothetical protein